MQNLLVKIYVNAFIYFYFRAYTQSRLYREIKMRSGLVVSNKKLQMLQKEQICEQVNGVWNLSSDQVITWLK